MFTPGGVARRVPRVVAITRDKGWFVICDVPVPGGSFGLCAPTSFLDGASLSTHLAPDELDTTVRPAEVKGVEVYSEGAVPPQSAD